MDRGVMSNTEEVKAIDTDVVKNKEQQYKSFDSQCFWLKL